jgi:molybdenum cofactor guanylyltransferase
VTEPQGVAGILLTGGASRRMGFDKALLSVEGTPNAVRLAGVLKAVAAPVVEVGPGVSGLPSVQETPAGAGPLVAICAGGRQLRSLGHDGPVLVLACDLPFMNSDVLAQLGAWPGRGSVVPLVAGRAQPLCARWSPEDMAVVGTLVQAGERSMRSLLARAAVTFAGEREWAAPGAWRAFADVDSPADLEALGLPPKCLTRDDGGAR